MQGKPVKEWSLLDLPLPAAAPCYSNSVFCKHFYSGTESRQCSCFIPGLQSDGSFQKRYEKQIIQCKKKFVIFLQIWLKTTQIYFVRNTFTSWFQLFSIHGAENQPRKPAKLLKPTSAASHMDLIDWLNLYPHSELTWGKPHTYLKQSEQS